MFGSSRAELYQDTAREAGDLEELTQKLSEDLRKYIVSLDFVPWLSREWFALAEPLRYIASIAGMENKLRKKAKHAAMRAVRQNKEAFSM